MLVISDVSDVNSRYDLGRCDYDWLGYYWVISYWLILWWVVDLIF